MTPEDARAELEQIGKRLATAEADRARAMADLKRIARTARNVVPIKHIADLAGVTRPTVYKMLEEDR